MDPIHNSFSVFSESEKPVAKNKTSFGMNLEALFKAMIHEAATPNPFDPESNKFGMDKMISLISAQQSSEQTSALKELVGLQKSQLNPFAAYLGKNVIVEGAKGFVEGSIDAFNFSPRGMESVTVKGNVYSLGSIRQIQSNILPSS